MMSEVQQEPSGQDGVPQNLAQYEIPCIVNPFQKGLTILRDPINLADDRQMAKNLMLTNDKEQEDRTVCSGLPTLGSVMSKRIYRQAAPKNYFPILHNALGIHWIYKVYFRTDQLTRHENLVQMIYYVKKYYKADSQKKDNCLNWFNTAPLLAQVIRSRRRPGIRVTMTPKTYDCRGTLLHNNRNSVANFLKRDRGFSPMLFSMNAAAVRESMINRILEMRVRAERTNENFEMELIQFMETNHRWKDNRLLASSISFVYPMKYEPYKPYLSWNLPRNLFGKEGYQNILSEFNQMPPALLLEYNICRVRRDVTLEINRFVPRRLPKKAVASREKFCEANEYCFKVISDSQQIDEYLGAVKIRRSTYSHEPLATVPFAYIGDKDDEKCKAVAFSLCHSDSVESLFSMSGWSSDSFASTATLTPGDALFNWSMLSKELCHSYRSSDTIQNPKLWAQAARTNHSARIALEVDERLIMANGDDGKRLCTTSKNPFFREILAKDYKCRLIRKKSDWKKIKKTINHLKSIVEGQKKKKKRDEAMLRLLEFSLRRLNCFDPNKKTSDRYRGLDISPAWRAAIDTNQFSDNALGALSQLISSRDSWVIDSNRISCRCDQMLLETIRSLPAGFRLLIGVSIWIFTGAFVGFLIV